MKRVVVAAMVVVGVCLLPGAANAADCQGGATAKAPAPELVQRSAHTQAAGDDPVVVAPATPTCDDGGYDIEFPDTALATDAVPSVALPAVTGSLPRTDFDGYVLMMSLLGTLLLMSGLLVHVLATLRDLETSHA